MLVELLLFIYLILIRLTISEIYILIYSSAYIDDWHETSKDYSSIYCDVVVGYLQSNDCGYLLNDYVTVWIQRFASASDAFCISGLFFFY